MGNPLPEYENVDLQNNILIYWMYQLGTPGIH